MSSSRELRQQAAKCRMLADIIISEAGRQALQSAAAKFEAEAHEAARKQSDSGDDEGASSSAPA